MKLKACLTAIALAAGVAAGVPAVAEVSVVKVSSPVLLPGSTYAWSPAAGIASGSPAPKTANEIAAQRLATETEAVLSSKGYRLADPSEADLLVVYRVLIEAGLDGNLAAQGGADNRLKAAQATEGTLVLDLYDRRSGRLVYRATSEKAISSKEASPERLNSVLMEMTKSLPL